MDVKTEQFNKTFYALNNRYPTQDEVDKSMQKFLSEEDQLIINNQPEESLVINIDEQLNLIKETNFNGHQEESQTEILILMMKIMKMKMMFLILQIIQMKIIMIMKNHQK